MKHLDSAERAEEPEIAQNFQPTGHTLDKAKVNT